MLTYREVQLRHWLNWFDRHIVINHQCVSNSIISIFVVDLLLLLLLLAYYYYRSLSRSNVNKCRLSYIARFHCCTFIIYSANRLSSRKCVINSVFSVQWIIVQQIHNKS